MVHTVDSLYENQHLLFHWHGQFPRRRARARRETGCGPCPVASFIGDERIDIGSDAIGIMFPAYWGKVPVIVRNFVSRLYGIKGKYFFAVGTCGGSLDSMRHSLEKDLSAGGGLLAACFLLRMPTNKFPPPAEKIARILALFEPKLDKIAEYVRSGRSEGGRQAPSPSRR